MTARLYRHFIITAVLIFGSALLLSAQTSHRVTRIVDGDTLVLTDIGTVRLIGVDTPETVDPRKPVEEFGKQSTAFLTGLALNKTVRVEYDQTRKDKYGRTLAYLYLSDGTFINKEVVRSGYGHAYTEYPFKFMDEFRAAAREAQDANRGLWSLRLGPKDVETIAANAAPLGLTSAAAPLSSAAVSAASESESTVYATKTGTKYHRAGCRSLASSQIPMSLKDASARYGACSICKPPTLAEPIKTTPAALPAVSAPRPAAASASKPTSTQCAATTKAGARCKRTASAGSPYCWQHAKTH